jgi:hypothetical protein
MDHRRDGCFVIMMAALMLPLCGCSREMPTASTGHDATVVAAPKPAPPDRAVTFIVPRASGTVRTLPELGILEIAPVSTDMQSSYFRTTAANREFRRGFAEFLVPNFRDVFSARIVLRETRATTNFPLPPDREELSMYTDVDLDVTTSDFGRPTSALATFETDANLPTQTFAFDASGLVAQSRGARLGFRVKLEADPAYAQMGFLGTAFARYSTPSGLRIEVTTTRVEANDRLQELIRAMALEPGLEAGLLGSLQRAGAFLGDTNPNNDGAACGQLRSFLEEVGTMELNMQLSSVEAFDLRELALNIMSSLGCPNGGLAAR